MRKRGFRCLCILLIAVSGCLAQTGSGTIQGTVKDSTGAVVPVAKVTIVHAATGGHYNTLTNESGFYLFPSIQVGEYQLSVESAGMEPWKGGLNLLAGQTAAVDPVLKTAGTATTVTVAGDVTPLVTTTNPTVATVVEHERIEQLPLNGRNITTLLYMTVPGLESGSVPRNYGLRYATEMLQDGALLENREWQSIPARPPGLDTIAEFRAETLNSSAKMNRPGTFILTTRSGTNEVHGSLFETTRNSAIGVARARTDFFTKPPHLARNEFGGSFGGPVYIPKAYNGRNKTFFFSSYEGYQLRQSNTRNTAVPTAAMRQGDFSGLVDSQGRRYTLYDPLTTRSTAENWARLPFINNQIPIARESPLAKYLYSITPFPTTADNPLVTSNFFGPGFAQTRQYTITTKIDHRLSDKDHLSFRASHNPAYTAQTSNPYDSSPTTLDKKANANVDDQQNDTGIVNWTHTFSPTFFGESLLTVSRDYRGQKPYTGSAEIASTLGLPNPFNGIGFPRIPYSMTTTAGGAMSYDSSINPTIDYAWVYNFDQNFTRIHGRHEFQFGFRFRYESMNTLEDQQISQGELDYNNVSQTGLYDPTSGSSYSAVPFTGNVAGNFFLGLGTYQARFNRKAYPLLNNEKDAYFQDNFKVSSRLTLNLGVRYEYNSPVNVTDKSLFGFDPKNKAVILAQPLDKLYQMKDALPAIVNAYQGLGMKFETPAQAGLPGTLVHKNLLDFGPRVGAAYRVTTSNHPTVLRAGYSIFAYPESLRLFQGDTANTIPGKGTVAYNPNSASLSPDGLPNYLLRSVPTIIAGVNSSNALDATKATGISPGGDSLYYMDPHQPTARAHEWSVTLERELMSNTVAKVSYVGTHGLRMAQYYSYNDAPSAYVWYKTTGLPLPTGTYANTATRPYDQTLYGTIQTYQKSGWSNDNSFQLELEHRYSNGYAFQIFYVMSNAMRVAGDGWRDDTLTAPNLYLPGMVPIDNTARDRLLYYRRDTAIPKHRVNWNFLVDLPFGQGKLIGRNSSRLLNAFIGGWQVAGFGQLFSRYFQLPTGDIANYAPIQYYGKKYPIQDCRSGVCYSGWLVWNGYIPANRINSYDPKTGNPNGVMGVPSTYAPFATPLLPTPKDGGSSTDPNFPFYETNTVYVPLQNGTLQRTTLSGFLDPMQNQFMLGPMQWNMSASAFKSVRFTERVFMRINVDFLNNVFNMPGTYLASTIGDGVITTKNSANSPRVLQLTMRLTF
jgi:hypothetical protein